jgi:GWxTD domain-containing protein
VKKLALLIAGVAVTSLALAQLSKYKDWAKSPEAYYVTPAEKQEWAAVKSDEEAEKFIAQYWAKRDPNPATAQNEFRDGVQRRIAAADEQFKSRRYPKGSESPRGRVFITLGAPNRASQARVGAETGPDSGQGRPTGGLPEALGDQSTSAVVMTWTYDKGHFDPSWGIPEFRVRFNVDAMRGTDEMVRESAVDKAIATVAEKSIVNPSGSVAAPGAPAAAPAAPPAAAGSTAASPPAAAGTTSAAPPAAGSRAPAPPAATGPASAAAPPAPATAALPAASRSALDALLKEKKEETSRNFWGGPFNSMSGEAFYAIELYVPGDKAPATPPKFGGVVTSEAGQDAATFWEDATLMDMKTGSRTDKVFERSIVLPPGSYRGAFGIFSSEGVPLVSASSSFKIEAKPTDFAVSPLILASTLTPTGKRPAPTEAFVFGVEKPIRVEPKANHLFAKEDSLWYFYTIWNPKLPEAPAPAAPAPAATPGAAATAPAAAEAKPRIQAKISVLRDGQPAFAPFTGPAEMQILAPGYYATGSEIPLATFEPGNYTFLLTVRDLGAARDSAAFKGIDRKEDFIVLKPDGSLPEKAAPAKPATKAKPPAKKG